MAKTRAPRAQKPKKENGGLAKFFLAIIMAFIVFIALLVIQSGILSNFETTNVVIATTNIPKGTDINENNYKEYFKVTELDSQLVPEGAIVDIEKVKDHVTTQEIAEKEVINTNALTSVDEIAQNIAGSEDTSDLIVSGFTSGSLSNSVCGILRRGDTIDITLIYEDPLTGAMLTDVLENIYVKNAYDSNGVEIYAGDTTTATLFNFLLTKEQDDLLNEIINNNGIVRIRKTNDPEF